MKERIEPHNPKSRTSFVLGEAVRSKTTGQRMYVDTTWDGKVPCVYFDAEKRLLVQVEVPFDDLEKTPETVRRIVPSKYVRIVEYELAESNF
ncbi:hypothetical protein FH581_000385 [Leptospira weilii]|uniref:hypothetical protein n=1 Tax=Leptospira weilii TaxID=28184 RepID=UPI001EF30267|nr:hypothetical protein [Leptospira weilii]ULH27638.1 hypothetical protein FH586_14675 [Leptospira weilii]ULH27647.1 hypothetical protein FH586_14725 [Leptospira weilii]ULH27656.1 hypothetical protein FH586_14775 [Leptospira weilii]UPY77338.1 hypothetical protein FH581_000335 [Leptospira weilii]UPY77347.1 hypothetical protein FH581_000385 [Leptospira weilii]